MAQKKRRSQAQTARSKATAPAKVAHIRGAKETGTPDAREVLEGISYLPGPAAGHAHQLLPWLLRARVEDAGAAWRRGERLEALELLSGVPVLLAQAEQALADELREQGATWVEIGAALNITKQSAQGRLGR